MHICQWKKQLVRLICVIVSFYIIISTQSPAWAAAGTKYESENNNSYLNADRTYNDYDNYGIISPFSDIDYWVVNFSYSGPANFYLGDIPTNCNYDMNLYASDGITLLKSSTNTGNSFELITYNVSANTNYYVRIFSAFGGSTTSYYQFRAKVYPSKTLSSVPLYQQETSSTCGCASGRMILKSYGVTVSENTFKNKATEIAGTDDYTYVYVVTNTITIF